MSTQTQVFVPDTRFFSENRAKFSPEQLMQYAGKWVVWRPDGTSILMVGDDFEATFASMQASGLNPHDAFWEHMSPADETYI